MSFNVHSCIPYGVDGATTANVSATATVIKNADPDVVLLQEVDVKTDRSGKVDQIAALSEYTGMKYYAFAKAISYQNGDFGVAVLSKYPIEYSKTHVLPKIEVVGSYVEQRVLCETRITLERILMRNQACKQSI
jgi:endonuclease/exonuclease/phosphatase family metal-dependent hydrolase